VGGQASVVCGHRGKVDNCQWSAVSFRGYVKSPLNHALLDFRLSLPEEWGNGTSHRRQACHVPRAVRYQKRRTRSQCVEMLDAWGNQVTAHGRLGHRAMTKLGRQHAGCVTTLREERGERLGAGDAPATPR